MTDSVGRYFQQLIEGFGRGWNRFWYTPSDPYALGAIRLATGLLALYFLLTYTPDLNRFFGDGGLLPPSLTAVTEDQGDEKPGEKRDESSVLSHFYSPLSYLHSPTQLYVAHTIGGVVLLCMTIGLFSRISTVLGLYVVLSYIHRAPLITSQFEPILAMLMFYLCFAPTGAALSVDRWWALRRSGQRSAAQRPKSGRYVSATVVIRLIQIHVAAACLMMGLAKIQGSASVSSDSGVEWQNPWATGQAVWLMIARPDSPWLDLTWLRSYPRAINIWTHAIVVFELAFGVLVWNRLARPLLLAAAVVMWGSLAMISGIAPLSVAMLIGSLAFVSPDFLRRITGASGAAGAAAARVEPAVRGVAARSSDHSVVPGRG